MWDSAMVTAAVVDEFGVAHCEGLSGAVRLSSYWIATPGGLRCGWKNGSRVLAIMAAIYM